MGKFKVPTLRNVALTAPYFHDGSAATLDDVLNNYAHGGRLIASGPNAGDGSMSVHRDPLVKGFTMTDQERADMTAFLQSLTDTSYVNDPRFANPSCPDDLPTSCPVTVPSFQSQVSSIVQTVCATPCHSPGQLAASRPLSDYQSIFNLKDAILNNVSVCNMPPPIAMTQLGEADRATLMSWIVCGAPNN